jgi:polysaccharide pyruvyl transferase WcaK-like protein
MARIGMVGYYGWGNYGDELFLDVFREYLAPHELVVLPQKTAPPYFDEPVEKRLKGVDALVIGGGDLMIPWALSELYWKPAYLAKPVFVYGVGVPTWGGLSAEVVATLARFVSHPNVRRIVMRDPESMEWVARHLGCAAKLSWSPDPVCALEHPQRAEPDENVFTLVTRAHQKIDPALVDELCRWATAHELRVRHLVLALGATARDDLAEAAQLPFAPREIVVRDSISTLTAELLGSRLVASMKFHGCVVALMSGIPCVALSRADKFVSFYRMLRLELTTTVAAADKMEKMERAWALESLPDTEPLRAQARQGLVELREAISRVAP